MKQKVIAFLLSGGGDTNRFFVPIEAYEWMQTVKPGGYIVPPEIIEKLEPFADELEQFKLIITGEHEATTGFCDNDVALLFASCLYQYENLRAQVQDAILKDWEIQEEEYEGDIY